VANQLAAAGISVARVIEPKEKKGFDSNADSVKVMTMHSSKGLEFPLVVIPGIGLLPGRHDDPSADAKLLYVAMTRSTDKLLLTASGESELVRRLSESLQREGA
jgi:superfamily I DNA/RNA helicase